MNPIVYIVIVNYKNWHDVAECIASLYQSTYRKFRIFVVDNDSRNGSLQHLMKWIDETSYVRQSIPASALTQETPPPYSYLKSHSLPEKDQLLHLAPIVLIQNDRNGGFASGNNVVLRLIAGEDAYVWLLNPDMTVEPGTLSELVRFAQSHTFRSIIGATVKFHSDPGRIHSYGGGRINYHSATVKEITDINDIGRVDYISGGSLFSHAKHFSEVGLLPENYFLYWEETDWCYQARLMGYELLVCTDAICYDKISTTIGKSFLADYYYTRNGLLFTRKYKPEKIPGVILSAQLRILKRLVTGQWHRAHGVYKGIRAYLKGI